MATVVMMNLVEKSFYKVRPFRPRSDYAHLAFEYIEELRKLIQAGFSQPDTYFRTPWIVRNRPLDIALRANRGVHSAKLEHLETLSVQANALLPEENRPLRGKLYGHGSY